MPTTNKPMPYYRLTMSNHRTGETKTTIIGTHGTPDVAGYEARQGWRLDEIEALDGPPPLTPAQEAEVQRILDGAARRLLHERLVREGKR